MYEGPMGDLSDVRSGGRRSPTPSKRCSHCLNDIYCSVECQTEAWDKNHREEYNVIRERRTGRQSDPWITFNGKSRCSPDCGAFNGRDGRCKFRCHGYGSCNTPAERKALMEDLVRKGHDIVYNSRRSQHIQQARTGAEELPMLILQTSVLISTLNHQYACSSASDIIETLGRSISAVTSIKSKRIEKKFDE
ncbi:hypothetical protein ARMGADRAFT_1035727 [Armillaria gallica]|uniref:MYND-type domain-containing protein n=1 Tax=Armillaria gallica TaxID=47427 RepID=A0A2H3CXR8_ARMGA|nr:hypothetical protein ARMGADRAFT_1035727 [Armillaria gallica]